LVIVLVISNIDIQLFVNTTTYFDVSQMVISL